MPTLTTPHTALQVYVPLAGVQTELLRATFEPNEVEVKCVNLQVGPLNVAGHGRACMHPAALPIYSLERALHLCIPVLSSANVFPLRLLPWVRACEVLTALQPV